MMIHRPFYSDKVEEWLSNSPNFSQRNQKRRNGTERSICSLSLTLAGPHINYSRQDYLLLKMEVKICGWINMGQSHLTFGKKTLIFFPFTLLQVSMAEKN